MQFFLYKIIKAVFWLSLIASTTLYFHKDELPEASFYDLELLDDPIQTGTRKESFTTHANDQEYRISPKYDYELDGVIVSYHNADDFSDSTHHGRWKDFINLRDLCVIWGSNVESEVYREMEFHNGTWTCWYAWPNSEVRGRFNESMLSNNHVLIDDEIVKDKLMRAEPGDHIRLKGMLVEYSNPGNGFHRGTSVTRTDRGIHACETVYVNDFEIVKKANPNLRLFYNISFWTAIASLAGIILMIIFLPYRGRYA
jgi:hypothetical protein